MKRSKLIHSFLIQSSKKSERNGRPKRRRRKLSAKRMKRGNASKPNSNEVETTLQINPYTASICEHLSDLLHPWVDHSFPRSDMLPMLAASPSLSTLSRVRQWREWHSMPTVTRLQTNTVNNVNSYPQSPYGQNNQMYPQRCSPPSFPEA